MSITITSRPDRNHEENNALLSRWLCSRQPIYFDIQRSDYLSFGMDVDSGFCLIKYNGAPPIELQIGDKIYLKAYQVNSYDGTGTITDIQQVTPTYFRIKTDIPASSNPLAGILGGFFNRLSRANYYVGVAIKIFNAVTGLVESVPGRWTPGPKGNGRLYVQGYLNGNLQKVNDFLYDVVNKKDPYVFGNFTLVFSETWNGGSLPDQVDPNKYWFVDSAKYLQEKYGQNKCDYLLQYAELTNKAKFLTRWKKPTLFPGYPFSLGFIYPEEFSGAEMTRQEAYYAYAATAGSHTDTIDVTQYGGVNHLTLSDSYPGNATEIEVWLNVGSIVQRGYHQAGYTVVGYHELVPPIAPDTASYDVTEKKRIKISKECIINPVYIRWRNPLGHWDYWLFSGMQINEDINKNTGTYTVPVDDIEKASYRDRILSAVQTARLTVGGNLALEDFLGVRAIYGSPEIQVLRDLDTKTWMSLQVVPENNKYSTKQSFVDFKISFDFPDYYTIPN